MRVIKSVLRALEIDPKINKEYVRGTKDGY